MAKYDPQVPRLDFPDPSDLERISQNANLYSSRENINSSPDKKYPTGLITYQRAKQILLDYTSDKNWLRSLIGNIVDKHYADSLDYRGLKREGKKIQAIAKKILNSRPKDK